jgi:hypothetical protein
MNSKEQRKNFMKQTNIILLMLGLSMALVTGCQTAQYVEMGSQSKFTYPNSNVVPLAPVKVEVSGPGAFLALPDLVTSDNDLKVFNAAMAKVDGSNLIVDYVKNYRSYYFLFFHWSTLELEGTAAQMTVGKQELH